jgi:heme exporter protein C
MTVILWAIYVGYLILRAYGGEDEAVARYAAVLGIVGVLDIPVIRVSVRLLHGIHPSVINKPEGSGSGLDPSMRTTLYVSSIAVLLLASWLLVLRMRIERLAGEAAGLRREIEGRGGAA